MYAIISELDPKTNLAIEKLRKDCFSVCGFEIPLMRWPFHLSWQGAETYNLPEVENRVQSITKLFAPIVIDIDGIGFFTGENPVLYFTVTRTPSLTALNQTLWESILPLSKGMNPYFSPEKWVPHISFIYGDENSAQILSCVTQKLIPMQLGWTAEIDHLSLVGFQDEQSGVEFRYQFTGSRNIPQIQKAGGI